jgi:hypothetical protein
MVVPARVSSSGGELGDGVARIRRGHPKYEAWRSYWERHPEDVVEGREQREVSEHLVAGLVLAVAMIAGMTGFSALGGEFEGEDAVALGEAVPVGVVIFTLWFVVGVVASLWSAQRDRGPSPRGEVEPPPADGLEGPVVMSGDNQA